jgi:hypothetical protein
MIEDEDGRTKEEMTAALDKEFALIGEALTNMHSNGVGMLESLERLERDGWFAAESHFPSSEEFLEIRSDLFCLADELGGRFPHFARRVKAFFDRIDADYAMRG